MKQKIISRIVAIWIMACMLLAGTTTVYAAYITIGVDLVRQAKTQLMNLGMPVIIRKVWNLLPTATIQQLVHRELSQLVQ